MDFDSSKRQYNWGWKTRSNLLNTLLNKITVFILSKYVPPKLSTTVDSEHTHVWAYAARSINLKKSWAGEKYPCTIEYQCECGDYIIIKGSFESYAKMPKQIKGIHKNKVK